MSFFDQPYYALTKAHMSRIGMWPEQSKYARIIRLLTAFVLAMSLMAPRLTRWNEVWEDKDSLMHDIPLALAATGIVVLVLRLIRHFDLIKLSFENMESNWKMVKNTSAVVVFDKYAERGRDIIVVYSLYMFIEVLLYWALCLSPVILDVIAPLNQTRSKIYICHTEMGIDKDKYYWFIVAHECIVIVVAMTVLVAVQAMYFTWTVHACALFEVVRFAELIENICNEPAATVLSFLSVMIVFTSAQALTNTKQHDMMIQSAAYTIGQILHLYINSIPGQELMNHSTKLHTIAYDLNWPDMSVKAQKLLIPIMIRSNKPCRFTARKVYVFSLESFGSTIRTVMSYFTILAQII